ncbi:MAG: Xaa-Pro aminopeptidase [Gammaproteobacteria bacterium]|nr:Xaa-Pro aminopeptidase [Gammaproteobacteria bacterium]
MYITQEEFIRRRQQFLSYMRKKSVAIVPSARECFRTGDATYPFRQNSDFFYLTGFNEPDAIAVFHTMNNTGEYVLFSRPADPAREIWDGKRAGQAGAVTEYKADTAFSIEKFDEKIIEILASSEFLYYTFDHDRLLDHRLLAAMKTIRDKGRSGYEMAECIFSVDLLLHEMRLFKSEAEIVAMRKAANISVDAHLRAMRMAKPGLFEYQIEAEMAYEILKQGARTFAYEPIVATGENACILHYRDNNAMLKAGDLLLLDVGAEYQNYASDITRTFPVNGKFSAEQKAIYELVLKAQETVIDLIKPDLPWNIMQRKVVDVLTSGLIDLGLLRGKKEDLIEQKAHLPFYMHSTGHWLGLDTHDVGRYKLHEEWRKLREGMVLTVEPGLYISPNNHNVDENWRGIGVRIEDDVLVTETGSDILSGRLPKTVEEIEKVCSQ